MKLSKYKHQIGVGGLVLSEYEKKLVNEVLDSNQLTYGNYSKRFEREFAKVHECAFGLYMNSGTSALHVALAALKSKYSWSDGDEVIVPAVTFVATSNIVLHNSMIPVFVDVEKDSFNLDPSKIKEKITSKTRAIIPVHLLGLPSSMDPIIEIAKLYNLSIIEDSCECMFAKYKGKSVGSIGDIGCFSTYVAHFLVTGVGGFATTNNPALAVDMRSLMNHGRNNIYISSADDKDAEGQHLHEIISKRFSFEHVGHSFRCTELEAAIGIGQLAKAEQMIARRKEIASKLTSGLSGLQDFIQLPSFASDRTHSFMLYGIVVKHENKVNLVRHLENLNIETRDLLPLVNQPIYKKIFGDIENHYPVAKWLNNNAFYIGCHPYMSNEEVEFIIEAFKQYFKK